MPASYARSSKVDLTSDCQGKARNAGARSFTSYRVESVITSIFHSLCNSIKLADVGEIATAIHRHWICESSQWLLDKAFRPDEDQNADRCRRFENRALLNKLCLSLARLMQAHPHYAQRRTSVAGICMMIGWETEENFGRPLEGVDRIAFEATVRELRITADDRRRYGRVLEEAEDGLW